MELTRGMSYGINSTNKGASDLILETRFVIPLNSDIDLKNYIIDMGILLLTENQIVRNTNDLIYFGNPIVKKDGYNAIEFLSDSFLVQTNLGIKPKIDKINKKYYTKPQQIRILMDELDEDIKHIKIIAGLYQSEKTGYTLKNLEQFTTRVINAGLTTPEEVVKYSEKNFFTIEQSAEIGTISIDRGTYVFKAESRGGIGNLMDYLGQYEEKDIGEINFI